MYELRNCVIQYGECKSFKGTVMQIEKALLNNRVHASKVLSKFRIPTIYNFAVI